MAIFGSVVLKIQLDLLDFTSINESYSKRNAV